MGEYSSLMILQRVMGGNAVLFKWEGPTST